MDEEVIDGVLATSRATLARSVRSLAVVDAQVTMSQYRALVVLASRGPQTVNALTSELGVTALTPSRMCDRLVREGCATRNADPDDRRRVVLTAVGRRLLDKVIAGRRGEIARMPSAGAQQGWLGTVARRQRFAQASGEVPEQQWGWGNGWSL